MADRTEILRELGLLPLWHLRRAAPDAASPRRKGGEPAAARSTDAMAKGDALTLSGQPVRPWIGCGISRPLIGLHSPPTSLPVPHADCARRATWQYPASATCMRSGCSSARRPVRKRMRRGEPFVGQAGAAPGQHSRRAGHEARPECLHRQRAQMSPAGQSRTDATRGRGLPPLSRPADRAHRPGHDRCLGQECGERHCLTSMPLSPACVAGCITIRACRSSSPITPPICCVTCPTRRRHGKICVWHVPLCAGCSPRASAAWACNPRRPDPP